MIPYSLCRNQIYTGDLLLYRPTRGVNKRIARKGPIDQLEDWQRYAHAGMAIWSYGVLLQVDMMQGVGGRVIRFSRELQKYSGRYDVYRVHGIGNAELAAAYMLDLAGERYGWGSLTYAALSQYFVMPALRDDSLEGSCPHCAQAISGATRQHSLDPIKHCADVYTTPNHLAVPSFSGYQFTPFIES